MTLCFLWFVPRAKVLILICITLASYRYAQEAPQSLSSYILEGIYVHLRVQSKPTTHVYLRCRYV